MNVIRRDLLRATGAKICAAAGCSEPLGPSPWRFCAGHLPDPYKPAPKPPRRRPSGPRPKRIRGVPLAPGQPPRRNCIAEGCRRRLHSTNVTGLCWLHPTALTRQCRVEGCGRLLRRHNVSGYCVAHRTRSERAQQYTRAHLARRLPQLEAQIVEHLRPREAMLREDIRKDLRVGTSAFNHAMANLIKRGALRRVAWCLYALGSRA